GRMEHTSQETTNTESEKHFEMLKWEIIGIALEAVGLKTEYKRIGVGVANLDADFTVMKAESKSFEHNLAALASDIQAGKLKAALTHAKAVAANVNAGLAVNADSPFA